MKALSSFVDDLCTKSTVQPMMLLKSRLGGRLLSSQAPHGDLCLVLRVHATGFVGDQRCTSQEVTRTALLRRSQFEI
jgi:hypothetical protein